MAEINSDKVTDKFAEDSRETATLLFITGQINICLHFSLFKTNFNATKKLL